MSRNKTRYEAAYSKSEINEKSTSKNKTGFPKEGLWFVFGSYLVIQGNFQDIMVNETRTKQNQSWFYSMIPIL